MDTLRLAGADSGTTLARGIAGVKWNVTRTLVLGGHIAFPLLPHGLTASLTPTVGFEYAF